jgi:hypothetical protein
MIMLISSLNDVEKIVDNNSALSWDGWTVIETKSSPTAWMSPDGAYQNGKWVLRKRYEWNEGWNIPKKFVSENEQQG